MADEEDFGRLGAAFDATGAVRIGPVGAAEARLMRQRDVVAFAGGVALRQPRAGLAPGLLAADDLAVRPHPRRHRLVADLHLERPARPPVRQLDVAHQRRREPPASVYRPGRTAVSFQVNAARPSRPQRPVAHVFT